MPHLSSAQKIKLANSINNNIGRTIFELISPEQFSKIARQAKISEKGFNILKEAHDAKRPIILVSGHYGNYDVVE